MNLHLSLQTSPRAEIQRPWLIFEGPQVLPGTFIYAPGAVAPRLAAQTFFGLVISVVGDKVTVLWALP